MNRTLVYGTATAVALMLGGCPARTDTEPVETVYGPPPIEDDVDESDLHVIDEPIEDVYGPPVPDALIDLDDTDETSESVMYALYGPPPEMGEPAS